MDIAIRLDLCVDVRCNQLCSGFIDFLTHLRRGCHLLVNHTLLKPIKQCRQFLLEIRERRKLQHLVR